jgi:hypothetical protein
MRAAAIFVAFFLLFTSASIAVPIPLFPGNMIPTLLRIPSSEYMPYLEALTNGLAYGLISWIVFLLLVRKIESSLSTDSKRMIR